jgi:uncharacterized repeat protein (TIGR03803 family)
MFDAHWTLKRHGPVLLLAAVLGLLLTSPQVAQAQTLTTLYSFTGGADGGFPNSGLTLDAQGNLYGTTSQGGAHVYGTVYEVTPAGTEKVLYSFRGGGNAYPTGGLLWDTKGNLYGVTSGYHRRNSKSCYGTVFELTSKGTKKVLYCFKMAANGAYPSGGLVRDTQGNLYGTTGSGGGVTSGDCYPNGCGTVFEVTPKGKETVLHVFAGQGVDGAVPRAGLTQDAQGNLYGTTMYDGAYYGGTVFELTASGHYAVLYNFSYSGVDDGNDPMAPLLLDAQGNFYGTTGHGGAYGDGTVFELTPTGAETILHSFNHADGQLPVAGLIQDAQGNLYGTTAMGGAYGGAYGYGTVFEVTLSGTTTVLHSFTGGADGANPEAGLVWDAQGNLYGTTNDGGAYGCGTVFKLTP